MSEFENGGDGGFQSRGFRGHRGYFVIDVTETSPVEQGFFVGDPFAPCSEDRVSELRPCHSDQASALSETSVRRMIVICVAQS